MKIDFVADDFGASQETNAAILRLAGQGCVSQSSVLAIPGLPNTDAITMPPRIRWGAHLYLTEYLPRSQNLLNHCLGRPLTKSKLLLDILRNKITVDDVIAEFDLQFEAIVSNGYTPEFIDTHMNIHWLPVIFPAIMAVARERNMEDSVRSFAQLDFGMSVNWRTCISNIRAKALGFKPEARVVVNCPGYKQEHIDIDASIQSWSIFLDKAEKLGLTELVVPCHPGLSPAENELYGSEGFRNVLAQYVSA